MISVKINKSRIKKINETPINTAFDSVVTVGDMVVELSVFLLANELEIVEPE